MRRLTRPVIVASAIALIAAFGFAVWGIPYFFRPVELSGPSATFGSQSARALVTAIVDEGQIELDGRSQLYQVLRAEVLEGEFKGIPFDVDYGRRNMRFDSARFEADKDALRDELRSAEADRSLRSVLARRRDETPIDYDRQLLERLGLDDVG